MIFYSLFFLITSKNERFLILVCHHISAKNNNLIGFFYHKLLWKLKNLSKVAGRSTMAVNTIVSGRDGFLLEQFFLREISPKCINF